MSRRFAVPFLFLILAVIAGPAGAQAPPVWVIVHMANSEDAAIWGASTGANGVEADLHFDSVGKPTVFQHGFPCDCVCVGDGVCKHLGSSSCTSQVAADTLLKTIAAQSGYGLVVIDSKVDSKTNPAAGTNVISLLDTALFANGYKGVVIVGSPKLNTFSYLQAAATAAATSPNASKIYFTIDGEGKDIVPTLQKLTTLSSPRIVYGTGISACAPGDYGNQIVLGAVNRNAGVIGFVYIWTIEKTDNAWLYVEFGANGVMTNTPDKMVKFFKDQGYTLAAPGTTFPPATSKKVITSVSLTPAAK